MACTTVSLHFQDAIFLYFFNLIFSYSSHLSPKLTPSKDATLGRQTFLHTPLGQLMKTLKNSKTTCWVHRNMPEKYMGFILLEVSLKSHFFCGILAESPSAFSEGRVIPSCLCYLMSLYISLSTAFISGYCDWRFIFPPYQIVKHFIANTMPFIHASPGPRIAFGTLQIPEEGSFWE